MRCSCGILLKSNSSIGRVESELVSSPDNSVSDESGSFSTPFLRLQQNTQQQMQNEASVIIASPIMVVITHHNVDVFVPVPVPCSFATGVATGI